MQLFALPPDFTQHPALILRQRPLGEQFGVQQDTGQRGFGLVGDIGYQAFDARLILIKTAARQRTRAQEPRQLGFQPGQAALIPRSLVKAVVLRPLKHIAEPLHLPRAARRKQEAGAQHGRGGQQSEYCENVICHRRGPNDILRRKRSGYTPFQAFGAAGAR